mmetsp:Transcript_11590/g.17835  ORF Transcript_11590/g.17835 Transcript_11590/m.17835 type:complete len:216 (-) Transcript_11590:102-749(-)
MIIHYVSRNWLNRLSQKSCGTNGMIGTTFTIHIKVVVVFFFAISGSRIVRLVCNPSDSHKIKFRSIRNHGENVIPTILRFPSQTFGPRTTVGIGIVVGVLTVGLKGYPSGIGGRTTAGTAARTTAGTNGLRRAGTGGRSNGWTHGNSGSHGRTGGRSAGGRNGRTDGNGGSLTGTRTFRGTGGGTGRGECRYCRRTCGRRRCWTASTIDINIVRW